MKYLRTGAAAQWSAEEIATVLELLPTHSNCQIAAKLPGRTRSAVSGIVNRLKQRNLVPIHLVKHYNTFPWPVQPRLKQLKPKQPKPKQPKPNAVVVVAVANSATLVVASDGPSQPCSMLDLDATRCRWPLWHDRADLRLYCGEPPLDGFPYCELHCHKAFRFNPPERTPTHAEH